ncbi:integrase catalytic domain-containing protein, partial [Trichonephila clavipes]
MKVLNFPNLKIKFCSDSTTAPWWIKEQGNWSVFVSNRVKEIRLLTKTRSWNYVPGNMNPADLLSRGCSPYKLLKSKWWEGPAWLKENPENWPTGKCHFTRLLIDFVHKKNCHAGIQMMQILMRERFWIVGARKIIKNVLKTVSDVNVLKLKLCQANKPPCLSTECRVADCVAFEIVGIDLAGSLFLKSGGKVTIGTSFQVFITAEVSACSEDGRFGWIRN